MLHDKTDILLKILKHYNPFLLFITRNKTFHSNPIIIGKFYNLFTFFFICSIPTAEINIVSPSYFVEFAFMESFRMIQPECLPICQFLTIIFKFTLFILIIHSLHKIITLFCIFCTKINLLKKISQYSKLVPYRILTQYKISNVSIKQIRIKRKNEDEGRF